MSESTYQIGPRPTGRTLMRYEDPDGSWVEIRTNHMDTERAKILAHQMALALYHIDIPREDFDDDTDGA